MQNPFARRVWICTIASMQERRTDFLLCVCVCVCVRVCACEPLAHTNSDEDIPTGKIRRRLPGRTSASSLPSEHATSTISYHIRSSVIITKTGRRSGRGAEPNSLYIKQTLLKTSWRFLFLGWVNMYIILTMKMERYKTFGVNKWVTARTSSDGVTSIGTSASSLP